ncbi:MAG: serine/threonine protein kinase [Candidatus Xenobia bacterium]
MEGSCLPGAVLQQRYRIEAPLSQGRNDVSYRALDLVTGSPVTVKELTDGFSDPVQHQRAVEQFHAQFRTLSNLSHPSLPRVHALVEHESRLFLVTDYIEVNTLESVVLQAGELPSQTHVLHWLWQLLDVLEYLHAQQPPIIYRDLRPATVMITNMGEVRLVDFGIAKMVDPARSAGRTVFRAVGSAEYAPPETFGMSRTSPRTDIYSLGATVYFALTGTAPPQSSDRVIRHAPLRPLRQVNPSVSPVLEAAVMRMMEVKQQDRPESMAEVRAMLVELRQPDGILPGTLRPPMAWVEPPDALGEKPTSSPTPGPVFPKPAPPPAFIPRPFAVEPAPVPPPPVTRTVSTRTELAPVPRTRVASWVLALVALVVLAGGVAFGVWVDHNMARSTPAPSPAHGLATRLQAG